MSAFGQDARKRSQRRWRIAAIVACLAVGSFGCSPASFLYFLMGAPEPTFPPGLMSLTEKKSPVTVVLLVSHAGASTETTDLFNADKLLARRLTKVLSERFKENGDEVTLVAPSKIEQYKARHPDWQVSKTPFEIGKHFGADYVITMEIRKMQLYEPGSRQRLYRGHAEIYVAVTDCNGDAESGPVEEAHYRGIYPELAPEPADFGVSTSHFRARFLDHLAEELSRYFVRHPSPTGRNMSRFQR